MSLNGELSGFGHVMSLAATSTFPQGIVISQFADDADPFDLPEIEIAQAAMGLNGDLVTWSKAVVVQTQVAVIPESQDDLNLNILMAANRVTKGAYPALDIITLSARYPSGRIVTLGGGKLVSAPPAPGIASAGRLKSQTYKFVFATLDIDNSAMY